MRDKLHEELLKEIAILQQRLTAFEKQAAEHNQRYEDLRKNERHYRALFEKAPDAITLLDKNGIITDCNQATEQLCGYSKNEFIGKEFKSLLTLQPDEIPKYVATYDEIMKGHVVGPLELEITRKDGQRRIISTINSMIIENGTVVGVQIFARDITEVRKIERKLKDSEEKYRHLVEQSLQGIVIVQGIPPRVFFANATMLNILGYTPKELMAFSTEELVALIHPGERDFIAQHLSDGMRGKFLELYEMRVLRKDGQIRWLEILSHATTYQGKPAVEVTAIDITERKQAIEALKQSEKKYKTITDNINVGIFRTTGSQGTFVEVNPALIKMFGFESKEELASTNFQNLYQIPEDWKKFNTMMSTQGYVKNNELFLKKKNGALLPCSVSAVAVKDEKGIIQYYDAIIEDISERKRAEEKLRESEEKFRTLAEQSPCMIFINKKGKIVYANQKCEEIVGYRRDDFYSPDFDFLSMVAPESIEKAQEIFNKHIQGEDLEPFEYTLVTKDGKKITAIITTRLTIYEGERAILGVITDITRQKSVEADLQKSLEHSQATIDNTLSALAKILETRDPYTAGHEQRVATLALAIAKELGLAEDKLKGLHVASVIHDVGKIYIPTEILNRPAALTQAEYALIKTHPMVGYEILKPIEFPWPVAEIVLQHHERLDGSGYPQVLKNGDILLEARILAVADVVEAMSSYRPYRPAFPIEETLAEIDRNKGVLYDVKAVEACSDLFTKKGFRFS